MKIENLPKNRHIVGGRFKSCVISAEEYFFICQRYIELNPVRANMVAHPADYKWSSYRFHAQESLDLQSELWQPHELYLKLSFQQETRAKRYQALFKYHIPEEELGRIRSATHSDMALGNERFKEEIEKLTRLNFHMPPIYLLIPCLLFNKKH